MRGEEGKGIGNMPQKAAITNKTGNNVLHATGPLLVLHTERTSVVIIQTSSP